MMLLSESFAITIRKECGYMARRVSERQQYLNQEYRRLRSNLMARMRRQEKKGIKVDWSSLPRKPKKVTEASLRAYQNGNLVQQSTGEMKFIRGYSKTMEAKPDLTHTTYDKSYEDMIAQNRNEMGERLQAKTELGVSNEPANVSPHTASYIDQVKTLIQSMPQAISFRSTDNQWVAIDYGRQKNYYLRLIDRAVAEEGVEQMEWYYSKKINEIAILTDAESFGSDEESVVVHDSQLADLLYPATVTFDIMEELWE